MSKNRADSPSAAIVVNRSYQTWMQNDKVAVLVILILTMIPYAQTWSFDFLNWDDPVYVLENKLVCNGITVSGLRDALFGFHAGNWHPLVWLSLMTEVQFFGVNSDVMHMTNVLMHLTNGLLLYFWLRMCTGSFSRSLCAAVIFVIHPLHVESVAWVTERKDVLSTLFLHLTLLFYSRYCLWKKRRNYALSLIAFLLGLSAKAMLVTVPILLLLIDVWPLRRQVLSWRIVWEKIPFAILTIPVIFLTLSAQKSGGAVSSLEVLGFTERFQNAIVSVARYCIGFVCPFGLSAFYPMPPSGWPAVAVISAMFFCLTMTGVASYLWRYCGVRQFAVGWGFFLISLAPVIGIVQVGVQSMADRYMYVPMTGLLISACWFDWQVFGRGVWAKILLGGVMLVLLVQCIRQVSVWESSVTLFEHSLAVVPRGNSVALRNLSLAFLKSGALEKADAVTRIGIEQLPNDGVMWIHRGNLMLRTGRSRDALACFRKATSLAPDSSEAWNNLGMLVGRDNPEAAIALLERALACDSQNASAWNNLGNACFRSGLFDEAENAYLNAIRLRKLPEAEKNLDILRKAGRPLDSP